MVCHALIIRLVDVAHVYQRIAHFILAAINECVDDEVDRLVAHCVGVHRQAVCVRLARYVGQLLLRPVSTALVPVGIQRVHISGASIHRAVNKKLDPVGLYVLRGVLLRVDGLSQGFVRIHPAFNFVAHAQHELHVTGFVHLLGGLIEIGVIEIGRPAVEIHRVTL